MKILLFIGILFFHLIQIEVVQSQPCQMVRNNHTFIVDTVLLNNIGLPNGTILYAINDSMNCSGSVIYNNGVTAMPVYQKDSFLDPIGFNYGDTVRFGYLLPNGCSNFDSLSINYSNLSFFISHTSTWALNGISRIESLEFFCKTPCHNLLENRFLTLKASCIGSEIDVQWEIERTSNDLQFVVQYSLEGINWVDIGAIYSKVNNKKYQYKKHLGFSNAYIRLKIDDKNGGISYSPIHYIESCNNAIKQIMAFPNPTVGIILLSEVVEEVSVINSIGKVIRVLTNVREIDLSNFPSGTFILYIKNKNKSFVELVTKQ